MTPQPDQSKQKTVAVDMSAEAVAERLQRCAAISEVCMKLKQATQSPVSTPEQQHPTK